MIDKKAIAKFLSAPRDDFSFVKQLPRADLLDALHRLTPCPDTDDLFTHQLAGLLVGIACPTFCFWYGMGTGKTALALRLIEYWQSAVDVQCALVLVPSQEAVYNWEAEIAKWAPSQPVLALADHSSIDKAEQWLQFERGIILVAYPSLNAMVTRFEDRLDKAGRRTGKQKRAPRRSAIDTLCESLGCLIADESTEFKETSSLTYRIVRAFAKRIPIRYALAGRPFGRDPADLWGQQFVIDGGESLGTTLGMFREAFYDKKKKYFGGPFSYDYTVRKDMLDELHRIAQHRSLRYSTEECVDLPPLVRVVRIVRLPDETLAYYDKIVKHLISARGDRKVIQNDFIRLRQLSSGFLGIANDEFGAKVEIVFDTNPKLDLTVELLRQMPGKAVVFFEFIASGKAISTRLKKEKIGHSLIWSGTPDRRAALDKFLKDPSCEVLVLNHMIGAYSLNLQVATTTLFYESPIGAIDRDQAERRTWRAGQAKRCVMFDIVAEGCADSAILAMHRSGQSMFDAVIRDPSMLVRKAAQRGA